MIGNDGAEEELLGRHVGRGGVDGRLCATPLADDEENRRAKDCNNPQDNDGSKNGERLTDPAAKNPVHGASRDRTRPLLRSRCLDKACVERRLSLIHLGQEPE